MHPGTRYLKDLVFETEITKWYSSDFLLLFYKIITLFINVNTAIIKIIKIDYFYNIDFFFCKYPTKTAEMQKKAEKSQLSSSKSLIMVRSNPFFLTPVTT